MHHTHCIPALHGLHIVILHTYLIIAERWALASVARPIIVVYSRFGYIYIYYIYYHTVQVAICALVNALVLWGKTPPAQVAVSRPSWAQVYTSGMQQPNIGSTRARFALRLCPCASCNWLLHPTSIDLCPRWSWHCNLRWRTPSILPVSSCSTEYPWSGR